MFVNLPDGEGNGTPLQYSCLENPMDGGAWRAAVHGVAEGQTRLSDFTFTFMPWRRKWQPTPGFLPGESQGRGSLVGCRLWGHTESDTTGRLHFHFHALEKAMASHSSVLAWRILGTGVPGGLPSMGLHRVGHDWSDLAAEECRVLQLERTSSMFIFLREKPFYLFPIILKLFSLYFIYICGIWPLYIDIF